jgi:hypothetical protein
MHKSERMALCGELSRCEEGDARTRGARCGAAGEAPRCGLRPSSTRTLNHRCNRPLALAANLISSYRASSVQYRRRDSMSVQ